MHEPSIQLVNHFLRFVFPFSLKYRYKKLSAKKMLRDFKKTLLRFEEDPNWQLAPEKSSEFILPYVNEFLLTQEPVSLAENYTFRYQMENQAAQRLLGNRRARFVTRAKVEGKPAIIVFPISHLLPIIYLFKTGIGMLVFDLELEKNITLLSPEDPEKHRTESLSLDHIICFNRNFRKFLYRGKLKRKLTQYLLLPDPARQALHHEKIQLEAPDYHIGEAEQPFADSRVAVPINDLVYYLMANVGAKEKDWLAIYEYRMLGYSYVLLRKENDKGEWQEVSYDEIKKPFYWLRHYSMPDYRPDPQDLALENNPYIFRSFENIYFGFSLDGAATLAWDSGVEFIRTDFHVRVREQYFKLFLLALHQQLLSHRIANMIGKFEQLKVMRMQQFDFIVRCWFPQVSNNKMYNEVYQRWREVLQVEPLFEEVKREIDELDEYWERERLNLEARLLNFITWFFFPFAFLFSLWGMNFLEIVQPPMSFKNSKVLLFSGAVVAVYFLILLLFRLLRGGRK